jgi:hypothetical protein
MRTVPIPDEIVCGWPVVAGAKVVHIAGADLQVGDRLRQRCCWCGVVLVDYALDRVAVPEGQDPRPATWPTGALVEVDGNVSWVVPYEEGQPLPANACAKLDPDVNAVRDVEPAGRLIITWPEPHGGGLAPHGVTLTDADTGEQITTATRMVVLTADASGGQPIAAELTMFCDEHGQPLTAGAPPLFDDEGRLRTATFRWRVAEMR